MNLNECFETLELKHGSSLHQVKSSYRRLCKKYHPDLNQTVDTVDKFYAVNRAYNFLLDFFQKQSLHIKRQAEYYSINSKVSLEDLFWGCSKIFELFNKHQEIVNIQPGSPNHIQVIRKIKKNNTNDQIVLKIDIECEKHKKFERFGDDLWTTFQVDSLSAISGCYKEITGIDRKKVKFFIPKMCQNGQIITIDNQGMPSSAFERGKLFVKIQLQTPQNLSQQQWSIICDICDQLNT